MFKPTNIDGSEFDISSVNEHIFFYLPYWYMYCEKYIGAELLSVFAINPFKTKIEVEASRFRMQISWMVSVRFTFTDWLFYIILVKFISFSYS